MTVTELREALQALEAQGKGELEAVTHFHGRDIWGGYAECYSPISAAMVAPHRHYHPDGNGADSAILVM